MAVPGARQGLGRRPGLRSRSGPGRTGQVTGPAAPRRYPRCHSASPARTSGARGHSFASSCSRTFEVGATGGDKRGEVTEWSRNQV